MNYCGRVLSSFLTYPFEGYYGFHTRHFVVILLDYTNWSDEKIFNKPPLMWPTDPGRV